MGYDSAVTDNIRAADFSCPYAMHIHISGLLMSNDAFILFATLSQIYYIQRTAGLLSGNVFR